MKGDLAKRLAVMPNDRREQTLNLPYYSAKAGQGERLNSILTNLEFIEAKCAAGMTSGLLNDYQLPLIIVEKLERTARIQLEEFGHFVQSQAHILSVHPELTFQQAANQSPETAPNQMAMHRWKTGAERRPWLKVVHRESGGVSAFIAIRSENKPTAATISDSGDRLAICDGQVRVYNARSGREILHLPADSANIFTAIALSPDGKRLACAEHLENHSSVYSIWDIEERRKTKELVGYSCRVLSLRFSQTGQLVGLGGACTYGGELALWDLDNDTLRWRHIIQKAIVRAVIFTPDGLRLVAAQGNGHCSFWKIGDGELEKVVDVHQDAVTALSISSSGNQIATSSKDGFCRVWPTNLQPESSGRLRQALNLLLNPKRRKGILFSGHSNPPTSVAFLDDSQIVSGDAVGNCYVWNLSDGRSVRPLFSGEGSVITLETSGDGRWLLAISSEDRTCRIFEKDTVLSASAASPGEIWFLHFLQNSNELILAEKGGQMRLLSFEDEDSGQPYPHKIARIPNAVLGTVSSNGRFILAVNRNSSWKLWDRKKSKEISGKFKTLVDASALIDVSPDGSLVCIFSRETVEFVSTGDNRRRAQKLPMIPGAMRFKDNQTLQIVGINTRISAQPAESIVVLDLYLNEQGGVYYWGPFEIEDPRNSRGFIFSGSEKFIRWANFLDEGSVIDLWDLNGKCHASREFSEAVKLHDLTNDEKWALISQPSISLCHIIDVETPDLQDRWLFPLPEALVCGAIQQGGDLIALSYKQGGVDILKKVVSRDLPTD